MTTTFIEAGACNNPEDLAKMVALVHPVGTPDYDRLIKAFENHVGIVRPEIVTEVADMMAHDNGLVEVVEDGAKYLGMEAQIPPEVSKVKVNDSDFVLYGTIAVTTLLWAAICLLSH